jgi:DNA-binding Lrp family transcriptional regulator
MDSTDIKLCLFLLSNSRTPYHELAGRLGLSINAVHKRIRGMVEVGIIRTFTARVSLVSLRATTVWVFGRSVADHPSEAHLRLRKNDSIYWVANSGGGYVYVGGYLRDISELDSFVSFVKREGEIEEPSVGILPLSASHPRESLHPLDYQILASLRKDSRKSATDVASEVRASAKTVHRRLERMIENGLVDFSMEWYPDVSNDIVSICHVEVARGFSRPEVLSALKQSFAQNILVDMIFGNLPNQLTLFLWTNSMRQMDHLREGIGRAKGVGSVTLNILQIGYMFDTWVDQLTINYPQGATPASI